MSFLESLAAQRQMFVDGLEANKGDINLSIFDDSYPDQAHFIYELLQNAEDTGATIVSFTLTDDRCIFEHNGERHFDEDDVKAITGYDNSTKTKRPDKIGKFGIGFKSVFVYTEAPIIYSRGFSFKILKRVLPVAVLPPPNLGGWTRFEFPFNNPSKPPDVAYSDIKAGLERLPHTTLLFLSHLRSICWHIDPESSGEILRVLHPENEDHIEVLKKVGDETTASLHLLRFSAPVKDLPAQTVSIAFPLELLPNIQKFDPAKPISQQLKIVPTTGCVAVYFPAEKETSGLHFHLHAPFVTELSRASIKDRPVNKPLFDQLAQLAATSLHAIRDLGLLTGEFLGVLPNPQDSIPERYQSIRTAIIEEMKQKPLTPTHSKSHAPAKYLLQAKASLKDLLTDKDLRFLVPGSEEPHRWAIATTQKNSEFLTGLEITQWDTEQFVGLLLKKAKQFPGPDPDFMEWLGAKPVEWHQRLYSLLYDYSRGLEEEACSKWLYGIWPLQIVRLGDGSYKTGYGCYFPSEGFEHDAGLPRVDAGVYTSGKNTKQQENARTFLKKIGVQEVTEAELVKNILRQRYTYGTKKPNDKIYLSDLKRFMAFIETEPAKGSVFSYSRIFKDARGDWVSPEEVFLDSPYSDTGLAAYFDALGAFARKRPLSKFYKGLGISNDRLRTFAKAVGVQTKLEVTQVPCLNNPEWDYLDKAEGKRARSAIDEDYTIAQLDQAFSSPSIELSRLVWRTMCEVPESKLKACYQRNANKPRYADSQIVHLLRDAKWVPQGDGIFVCPAEASRILFPYDEGDKWLKEIHFGKIEQHQSEEDKRKQAAAGELGFTDKDELHDGLWFARLDPKERQRVREEIERNRQLDLPEHEPRNPERRAERVKQQAANDPGRATEKRERSVSVNLPQVKEEAKSYLEAQYTNSIGEMICQVCWDQRRLPFKLDDDRYYFETVEFLSEQHLQNLHYQNYLALCPTHAAMYKHANGSRVVMMDLFREISGNELEIILARENATIYFTGTHAADLRAVIAADQDTTTKAGDA